MHSGKIINNKNGYDVMDCKKCGFIHVHPYPSDELLEKHYSSEYYTKEKPNYISEYKKDMDWWKMVYEYRYKIYSNLLKGSNKSILDIGSGPGHFLYIGKNNEWETLGLEPNIDAYNYSKNDLKLNILNTFYKIGMRFEKKYDVINLGEVLEHLKDPKLYMEDLVNNLNTNGLVSIIVPNDFSPFQKLVNINSKRKDWWIHPPIHLNYFTFDSLAKFFKDLGLEIVLSQSTFPIEMFCFFGENYIDSPEFGREVHKKRMNFEMLLKKHDEKLIYNLYNSFAKLNLGREIFMIAKKIK